MAAPSQMAISVVSTGARSAERRDLFSTISGLSWRGGPSTRPFGPWSGRRKSFVSVPSRSLLGLQFHHHVLVVCPVRHRIGVGRALGARISGPVGVVHDGE